MLPCLDAQVQRGLDAWPADVRRNGANGLRVLHPFGRDEAAVFASVGLTLSAAAWFATPGDDLLLAA